MFNMSGYRQSLGSVLVGKQQEVGWGWVVDVGRVHEELGKWL